MRSPVTRSYLLLTREETTSRACRVTSRSGRQRKEGRAAMEARRERHDLPEGVRTQLRGTWGTWSREVRWYSWEWAKPTWRVNYSFDTESFDLQAMILLLPLALPAQSLAPLFSADLDPLLQVRKWCLLLSFPAAFLMLIAHPVWENHNEAYYICLHRLHRTLPYLMKAQVYQRKGFQLHEITGYTEAYNKAVIERACCHLAGCL